MAYLYYSDSDYCDVLVAHERYNKLRICEHPFVLSGFTRKKRKTEQAAFTSHARKRSVYSVDAPMDLCPCDCAL